jgi:hypothetical protein
VARRETLPDDLKELVALCRAGKLFAVQEWIKQGRRYQLPPGTFTTSPLRVAIDRGFHSLVQVLLEAGANRFSIFIRQRAQRLGILLGKQRGMQ